MARYPLENFKALGLQPKAIIYIAPPYNKHTYVMLFKYLAATRER
jgi:hypothetical protein